GLPLSRVARPFSTWTSTEQQSGQSNAQTECTVSMPQNTAALSESFGARPPVCSPRAPRGAKRCVPLLHDNREAGKRRGRDLRLASTCLCDRRPKPPDRSCL